MFALLCTLIVFLHYHISLLLQPTSLQQTIRSLLRKRLPRNQNNPHHHLHNRQNQPPDPPPIPPPDAIDVPSIYEATEQSRVRRQTVPIPPRTRINMARRFMPWDGSLPTRMLHSQEVFDEADHELPKVKHWLHKSSHRPVIKNPFGPGYQDSEQPPFEFPHPYPQALRHDVSGFRRILPLSALFQTQLGTIVIPRHHNTADFLLIVTHTDTSTIPPTGPSALLARFLVCSRTVLHYIPSIRGQASHQSNFYDGQRLNLPDGTNRIYPFFLFKMPQTDLTSLWIILTIIHQRFPTAWSTLDLPLPLLFNICKTMDILEISGTSTVNLLRQKLLYTLNRHAELFHPQASNTPDVAMWVYIAKTFSIPTNFSALWAHLIISTWRFTSSSHAVDRYTPPPPHHTSTNFKYGNWYWISHLPESLRAALQEDRTRFLNKMLTPWSNFRSIYHLPSQSAASAATILTLNSDIDGSALDLKDHILGYADQVLAYHNTRSLMMNHPNRPLNPRIMSDITRLKSTVQDCFSQIPTRDINNNLITISHQDLELPGNFQAPLYPPLQTPPELDDLSSRLEPTIFTYQSGANYNLIYWRNSPPSSSLLPGKTRLFGYTIPTIWIFGLLTQFYIELSSLFASLRFASLDLRSTLWLLLCVYYLHRSTIMAYHAIRQRSAQRQRDDEVLESFAENYNWSMDDSFSAPGSVNPKGTPARIGPDWRRFTPLENFPDNTYLAVRKEMVVNQFRAERARRWAKEGRDRWGRLPTDEGFGVPPPGPGDGKEEGSGEGGDNPAQEEEEEEEFQTSGWNREGGLEVGSRSDE
ncbi:hypothetical protein TWF970_004442 [Orbilia oligospora]|uniref:F-box domain-containing protein n=1 Tax=Orbilia oligospora TaxID=2813651 RepID=A0A7C8R872_ORBOL|nr:hypothetical protein TWF970_004442 [Orbilia oligospora]